MSLLRKGQRGGAGYDGGQKFEFVDVIRTVGYKPVAIKTDLLDTELLEGDLGGRGVFPRPLAGRVGPVLPGLQLKHKPYLRNGTLAVKYIVEAVQATASITLRIGGLRLHELDKMPPRPRWVVGRVQVIHPDVVQLSTLGFIDRGR